MPYYEYHCGANGRTVEVRHSMSEVLTTWGEVVERSGVPVDTTAADAPVNRLMSAPVPLAGSGGDQGFQGCGGGCACVPQN